MKKLFLSGIILTALFVVMPAVEAQIFGSEVNITRDGQASFSSMKIMQMSGTTIFARLYWGDAYVRITIKNNSKTKFLRATNEATTLGEFSVGNYIDASGELESGSDTLSLVATQIKNTSLQRAQATLTGTVLSINGNTLMASTNLYGTISINISSASITKGSRSIGVESIKNGDKITSASGDYDFKTKILNAKKVVIYVNMSNFSPQTFQGILNSLSGTTLPASMNLKIGGTEYSVNLPSNTEILNTARGNTSLVRFQTGDTVRVYGKMKESDSPIIDAEIVRNISL